VDAAGAGERLQLAEQRAADPEPLKRVLDKQRQFGATGLLDHELAHTAYRWTLDGQQHDVAPFVPPKDPVHFTVGR
jgi:hypothetical protein